MLVTALAVFARVAKSQNRFSPSACAEGMLLARRSVGFMSPAMVFSEEIAI